MFFISLLLNIHTVQSAMCSARNKKPPFALCQRTPDSFTFGARYIRCRKKEDYRSPIIIRYSTRPPSP